MNYDDMSDLKKEDLLTCLNDWIAIGNEMIAEAARLKTEGETRIEMANDLIDSLSLKSIDNNSK